MSRTPSHALRHLFELAAQRSHTTLAGIEGLRGWAILTVFLAHVAALSRPWWPLGSAALEQAQALLDLGAAGVDLFFVISGLLLHGHLMTRATTPARFLRQRLRRIYPAFAAVFVLYVLLSLAMPGRSRIPEAPADAALYLLQNALLLPGLWPVTPMITVAWSLSYEMAFYVALACWMPLSRWQHWPARTRVALLLGVWSAGLLAAAVWGGPVRLLMFVTGMLAHEGLARAPRWSPPPLAAGIALVGAPVLAWMLAQHLPEPVGAAARVAVLSLGFGLVAWAASQNPPHGLARALSWTPLRWLGNISYSVYLTHGLALNGLMPMFGRMALLTALPAPLAIVLAAPGLLVAALVPALLLYAAVEHPWSLRRPAR